MSLNTTTVNRYLDGFRTTDHARILSCLTEDIEWIIPGLFHIRGKEEFDREIESDTFDGPPTITVIHMVEEHDVVIVVLTIDSSLKIGNPFHATFCDVFEMSGGKIKKLTSYMVKD